jgi:predicted transcriptional regulator of viral defense system
MAFTTRSLSPQESRVVLALSERGQRETTRAEIVKLLGATPKAADHVIESLRRKGWLERASWGEYLLIPAEQGPDALGDSNLLALASRIADPYYIGFSTAAAHYGLTTQHRNVIFVVTPVHLRARSVGEAQVRIVNPSARQVFRFRAGRCARLQGHDLRPRKDRHRLYRPSRRWPAAWAKPPASWPPPAGGLTGPRRPIISNGSDRQLWSGDLPGSSITSRPMFRPRSANACSTGQLVEPQNMARSQSPAQPCQNAIGYDETWRLFVNVTPEELHGSAGLGRRKAVRKES